MPGLFVWAIRPAKVTVKLRGDLFPWGFPLPGKANVKTGDKKKQGPFVPDRLNFADTLLKAAKWTATET